MVIWLAVFSLVCLRIATGNELVTCTSVIKLQNVQRGVRLHSHEVKYGSGSGQQSVTGILQYWIKIDISKLNSQELCGHYQL